MKYIPVEQIEDGMHLAEDVVTPDGDITLLRKDLVLRAHFIRGLQRQGVEKVLIIPPSEQTGSNFELLSPRTKLEAIDVANTLFNKVKLGRLLNSDLVTAFVGKMVDELLSQDRLLISLHRMGTVEKYLIEHSINTTIVSTVIGIRCGFPREKLLALAKGAFLHDIGKTKVPEEILHKPGQLTNDEFETVKRHPQFGYNIIREMTDCTVQTAVVSLQHHEKYCGDGYPAQLSHSQIYNFSRIVAIADVYDALTTDRCYRPGLAPDKALGLMTKERGMHFDPYLFDIFASKVVLYPVGTFVELSDGSVGNVVSVTEDVQNPEVNLITVHPDGTMTNRRVNLANEADLMIRSSF